MSTSHDTHATGGEGNVEADLEELWERVAVVVEEERVVAEWRHGDADLGEVVKVLHHGDLGMSNEGRERSQAILEPYKMQEEKGSYGNGGTLRSWIPCAIPSEVRKHETTMSARVRTQTKMVDRAGLACVRPQGECVEPTLATELSGEGKS